MVGSHAVADTGSIRANVQSETMGISPMTFEADKEYSFSYDVQLPVVVFGTITMAIMDGGAMLTSC